MKSVDELCLEAIDYILIGSDGWNSEEYTVYSGEFTESVDLVEFEFFADSGCGATRLGSWDIRKEDLDNRRVLDEISEEVEVAAYGIQSDSFEIESIEPDVDCGRTITESEYEPNAIFKLGRCDWSLMPGIEAYDGTKCIITDVEYRGRTHFDSYYKIRFTDGTEASGISGYCLEMLRDFKESVTSDKPLLSKLTAYTSMPEHGVWLRYANNTGDYLYIPFEKTADAEQAFREICEEIAEEVYPTVHSLWLGLTTTDGRPVIRWLEYADNLIEKRKKAITENVVTTSPSEALAKIGYKEFSNANGCIEFASDTLYSPNIAIFGDEVEILPLVDLPVTMTVEDHGKLVARLAEVQKAVEDLR